MVAAYLAHPAMAAAQRDGAKILRALVGVRGRECSAGGGRGRGRMARRVGFVGRYRWRGSLLAGEHIAAC